MADLQSVLTKTDRSFNLENTQNIDNYDIDIFIGPSR